jgi:hypothetical protein
MTPPFVGARLLTFSRGCGSTGGWAPTGVDGLLGGFSSACDGSSSELVDLPYAG